MFLMANETKVTQKAHSLEVESLALFYLIVSATTTKWVEVEKGQLLFCAFLKLCIMLWKNLAHRLIA